MPARTTPLRLLTVAAIGAAILLRVPSLAQPAGADQALYAYVGQRILHGELPYRDAWDQKPPGVHVAYAALFAAWPDEAVIAAADLALTLGAAAILVWLGRRLLPDPGAGPLAAFLLLFLGNPIFGRLGGVRVRGQCEVFIALAAAGAIALAWKAAHDGARRASLLAAAGALVGVATAFKYNAIVYALPVSAAALVPRWIRDTRFGAPRTAGDLAWMALGGLLPLSLLVAWFAAGGALDDLYRATIRYNLLYSGETYGSRLEMVRYLVTFPVAHARVDALWLVGGAGTAVLLAAAWRRPIVMVPIAWVAAACLAIAINGSRGLPQYFVQAAPALACAAGVAGAWAWARLGRWPRAALVVVVLLAVERVAVLPKIWDYPLHDLRYLAGRIDRDTYLDRFGGADSGDKYSALAVARLARLIRERTAVDDRVLVFGFSPWAYVGSGRASASRFFWSRPVIIGFEDGVPGYGVGGLLAELRRREPRLVVLQERDWDPDGPNSADFFLDDPRLAGWLEGRYRETDRLHNYRIFTREDRP